MNGRERERERVRASWSAVGGGGFANIVSECKQVREKAGVKVE